MFIEGRKKQREKLRVLEGDQLQMEVRVTEKNTVVVAVLRPVVPARVERCRAKSSGQK